jgi:hypothetical protein
MNAPAQNTFAENPWARWQAALRGERLDLGERGNPPVGFFRFPIKDGRQEAVAIWRDEGGELQCLRNIFGTGEGMTALQIDEMFASEHYAIPRDVFDAVTERGEPWPEIYTTRLRTKDIVAGVVWTEDYARAQLAADVETHDEEGNPRAVIGGNNPPADLPPDEALAARILNIGKQLAAWLATIGGKPTTQAQAETLGNYANKFKDCENEAVAAHKAEKEPFLKAGREVDAKWFAPVRDKAVASRAKALALIKAYTDAEDERRKEAARIENEARRTAAEKAASVAEVAPEPLPEIVPERAKVSTLRGGGAKVAPTWTVTNLPAFVAHIAALENPPPDLIDTCAKLARRYGAAGVKFPGMELK